MMEAKVGSDPLAREAWPFRPWVCAERSGRPESYHEGILVVVDDEGTVRAEFGDFGGGVWSVHETISLACPDPTPTQMGQIRRAIEAQTETQKFREISR